MDNQTGLTILSSVLDKLSWKGIDVREFHKLLMKGCYLTGQDDDITNILGNAIKQIHIIYLTKKKVK
jgi:hypothetical protein